MKSVCVFLGSSTGSRPEYRRAAEELGVAIARRHLTLVYGGGSIGLMGVLADAAVGAGADVIGVVPEIFAGTKYAHTGITELRVVPSLNERKTVMASLADGFVTLPGAVGTLDELFEMLACAQLGPGGKPCVLVNVAHYYDKLLRFLDDAVSEGFLKPRQRELLAVAESAEAALERMLAWPASRLASG